VSSTCVKTSFCAGSSPATSLLASASIAGLACMFKVLGDQLSEHQTGFMASHPKVQAIHSLVFWLCRHCVCDIHVRVTACTGQSVDMLYSRDSELYGV